ncbi:unnamed protein product [Alternaria alternata]
MSSIKQVQDLQSQIAELTHMNSQLRTKVSDKDPWDTERTDTKRRLSEAHAGTLPGPRQVSFSTLNNFEHVRSNIRTHSKARMAQDLEICPEVDCWPVFDGEIRRRLWWSIYVRDRIISLETSKSMIINESDCEISLPSSLEDRYIQPNSSFRSMAKPAHFTGFVANIHITRLYAPLHQVLRSSVVLPQTLQSFDEELRLKLLVLPEAYQPDSSALFDVTALPTIFCLLSARFHMYRRNLTPLSGSTERANALKRCVSVSQDTAKYVSRALHNPPKQDSGKGWEERVASIASNTGEYKAALVCLHLSRTIGNVRKTNLACGKNVAFFLERMFDRVRSGQATNQQLEQDEEMIAYVSADAQSSLQHSWVWVGDNLTSSSSTQEAAPTAIRSPGTDEPMRDALPLRTPSGSPMNGATEADDWAQAEQMIRQLMDEHLHRSTQPPAYYPPPHNPVKRVQLATDVLSPPKPTPNPSPTPSGTSRISIANII